MDFLGTLTTLMRRKGDLSLQQKFDILYANMRPDYKLTMRTGEIFSLEDMLRQAEHIESYMHERALLYRPPPPPTMALVQETAYHLRKKEQNKAFGNCGAEIFPGNGIDVSKGEKCKRKTSCLKIGFTPNYFLLCQNQNPHELAHHCDRIGK